MSRIERERHQDLSDVVDRLDVSPAEGGAVVLVTTTTVSSYPTSAGAFYAANPTEIDGSEIEGGAATYTPDSSRVIYVLNQGAQVPPGRHARDRARGRGPLGVPLRRMKPPPAWCEEKFSLQ